ncbi:MAG: hypothetical protein DHS20C14_08860 [Phycisphaeraceae bacterium]|nr:MAG: hypothetical protein DHS20C14_08860 [Phycisphaeraceae bacterium]
MRVPLTKAWRAYPALDAFTDAECRVYLREARRAIWIRGAIIAAACLLLGAVVGISIALSLRLIVDVFNIGNTRNTTNQWLLFVAFGAFAVAFLPIFGFLVGSDIWSRRALRRRLSLTECGMCRYNLVGLAPITDPSTAEDAVQCPECGMLTPLRGSGMTRADLMPRSHPPTTRPPTP